MNTLTDICLRIILICLTALGVTLTIVAIIDLFNDVMI